MALLAAGCAGAPERVVVAPPPATTTTTTVVEIPTTSAQSARLEPESPLPRIGPTAVYATGANPLHSPAAGRLAREVCVLPAWPVDTAVVPAFFDVTVDCLNRAWRPVLERLRLPFSPPRLQLAAVACDHPPEDHSYYCDGVIHLDPVSYLRTSTGSQGVPAAVIGLLAHEYAHHIQHLTGILFAAKVAIHAERPNSESALELSRRVELQAQCLAGLFVGATFDQPGVDLVIADNYTRGDSPGIPQQHGSPPVFGAWFAKGTRTSLVSECNTWIVPSTELR